MTQSAPSATPMLERAVRDRIAARAEEWFPDVGPQAAVRLRALVDRPRALLYAATLGDEERPRVLVKVRRGWPGEDGGWSGTRPRLVSSPLPALEQVSLEYSGLLGIAAAIDPVDPRFRAVRPLDHLVEHGVLLMDWVTAPTLRQLYAAESRLSMRRRTDVSDETWQRVGAWLRVFQERVPAGALPPRQSTREEVVERFDAYARWFADRPRERRIAALAAEGGRLAAEVLPERLVLATGHGDFAPRNVFVHDDGRIAVFDPLPRWAAPRLDDLCRFLVSLRLAGVQVHSRGLAYGQREMDRREQAVLAGYGRHDVDPAELRCLQLLLTLDTWSSLVDGTPASWPGRLRRSSAHLAGGQVRREARRLLDLASRG